MNSFDICAVFFILGVSAGGMITTAIYSFVLRQRLFDSVLQVPQCPALDVEIE